MKKFIFILHFSVGAVVAFGTKAILGTGAPTDALLFVSSFFGTIIYLSVASLKTSKT